MLVKQAMLANPLTVKPDTSIYELIGAILGTNQTTAGVLDHSGKLVGIVGAHDILRKLVPRYLDMGTKLKDLIHDGYFEEKFVVFQNMTVESIMVQNMDWVAPDDTIIKAAAMFVEKRRKTLPVLDRDGNYLGVITRRSILACVLEISKPKSES